MLLDLVIVVAYFAVIFMIGMQARLGKDVSSEEYFLSSRSLRWPTIAISTLATNISAGHFISIAGAAYVFGLAQGNFELNAVFGIVVAAFFFVPLYLRTKVVTITQFFESIFGPGIAVAYSALMMVLYAFMYLGMSLFLAAYAIDGLFGDLVAWIHPAQWVRLCVLVVALGLFSAVYTYLGGLSAVVRTDIAQFVLLLGGGFVLVFLAIHELGGWRQLYAKTGDLMHLHLPRTPEIEVRGEMVTNKIPWTAIIGMNLLNLNYWGANQVILQRALAARSLRDAQIGLLVGGVLKYVMVLIIVVPGIALAGILGTEVLADPDQTYIRLVNDVLPTGLRGLILCGLFASLMSTVDSIFNSVSTLWSIDVYKRHLRPEATDQQVVAMGKKAILGALCTGLFFAFVVVYYKTGEGKTETLTHWFKEMSFYIKNGFVVLVTAAVFLIRPSRRWMVAALAISVAIYLGMKLTMPEMNYMVRSSWAIVVSFAVVAVPTMLRNGWRIPLSQLIAAPDKGVARFGMALMASLVLAHIVFH
ncbi:MAG: sodium/solute symporter [Myxococcota bacterium]|nr:sodium/solute symporter [Myxococcota bacterium]